jgi:hypothetical protein
MFGHFFTRHWRGEYSLPFSYWVVGVIGNVVFAAIVGAVVLVLRREGFNPWLVMGALTLIWGAGAFCQLFQAVGVWRSALRYRRDRRAANRSAFWSYAAQAAVVLGALTLAAQLVRVGVPQVIEASRMAFLDDPGIPPYGMRLMRNGEEAEIAGGFKFGLARDAEKLFASAPNLKLVHLNSGGGRLGEAQKLAQLIRDRGLSTYSSASCSSACVIAFLAGQQRWLKNGAKLGFHRENFAGIESSEAMRKLLLEAGLEPSFVGRAVQPAAASMWYPSLNELIAAKVISGPVDAYRFAASGYGLQPDHERFARELRQTPLFAAIAETDPQGFETIVDGFSRGYAEGQSEGAILDEVRNRKIAPVLLAHMVYADDQLLADYAGLMADQYEALGRRDPAACYRYAAQGADMALVNLLPPELKQREMALSEKVVRSTTKREPPTDEKSQPLYRLIFNRLAEQYGAAQVRLLADPAKVPPVEYGNYCKLATAMFRIVAALPPEQAGEVMSHIFATTAPGNGRRK